MVTPKKRKRSLKKHKIKVSTEARIVSKNDATRVARPDTTHYPRMQAQMPRTVAPVFRVKIKKKQ